MPADVNDFNAVGTLVQDTLAILHWLANPESRVTYERQREGRRTTVSTHPISDSSYSLYVAALAELDQETVPRLAPLLQRTTSSAPVAEIIGILTDVGWGGQSRQFKVHVVDKSGRQNLLDLIQSEPSLR
jgi:hypothetical protein